MTPTPKTAAAASQLLTELAEKREGLIAALGSIADQRKAHAAPAEFGDRTAAKALQDLAGEETLNRSALENLALAIDQMKRLADDFHAAETKAAAEEHERQETAALEADRAKLLELDDAIDDALDHARTLLKHREQLCRNPRLVAARRRGRGTLISARQIGITICQYFHTYINEAARMSSSYLELRRIAEMDGRAPRTMTILSVARPPLWHDGHFRC